MRAWRSFWLGAARTLAAEHARLAVFRALTHPVSLPAKSVEKAFLEANPDLRPDMVPDMVTVTCKTGRIQEVRICLTKALEPRDCSADVARDCTLRTAVMDAAK